MEKLLAIVGAGLAAIFLLSDDSKKESKNNSSLPPKEIRDLIWERSVKDDILSGVNLHEAVREHQCYYIKDDDGQWGVEITHEEFAEYTKKAEELGYFYYDETGSSVWDDTRETVWVLTDSEFKRKV